MTNNNLTVKNTPWQIEAKKHALIISDSQGNEICQVADQGSTAATLSLARLIVAAPETAAERDKLNSGA